MKIRSAYFLLLKNDLTAFIKGLTLIQIIIATEINESIFNTGSITAEANIDIDKI